MAYKKAITPIIAVILLLMMTVVASSAAYFWMTSIQSSIQESVQTNLENSFAQDLTSFTLVSTLCESTPDNVTVILMNTGNVDINSGDLVITLSNSGGSTLNTIIDDDFNGIIASETTSLEYESTYDIQPSTTYTVRVTIPGGSSMSDTCLAD